MRYLLMVILATGLVAGQGCSPSPQPKALQPKASQPKAPQPTAPIPFVMQMTTEDPLLQRRAFMQIQKVLADIGADKVKIEVVAYEGGILSLLSNNASTAGLLETLHRQGVKFKACRISVRASDLAESDFPLEVEFVLAGAPEMIRLQMKGYRYWRP